MRNMKYRIERYNGSAPREATSMRQALRIAHEMTGAATLFRGAADYQTDWDADGERGYGYATDYWRERRDAHREMSTPADVVIVRVG